MVTKTAIELLQEQNKKIQDIVNPPHLRALKKIDRLSVHKQFDQVVSLRSVTNHIRNEHALNRLAVPREVARLNASIQFESEALKRIENVSAFPQTARIQFDEASRIATRIADSFPKLDTRIAESLAITEKLRNQLATVPTAWVPEVARDRMLEGFGAISRASTIINSPHYYQEWAREAITDELGTTVPLYDADASDDEIEESYIRSGMEAGITAIPTKVYSEVLFSAGLTLKSEYLEFYPETDLDDYSQSSFNFNNNAVFTAVEVQLRKLVHKKMCENFGENWIDEKRFKQLSKDWQEKRDQAISRGELELNLIEYSDFMDLEELVVRKDHWNGIFSSVFKKKDHFQVSMQRLHACRLPLAHSRPLVRTMQLTLLAEASLLLRYMNMEIME